MVECTCPMCRHEAGTHPVCHWCAGFRAALEVVAKQTETQPKPSSQQTLKPLSRRQADVLDFIKSGIEERGYPPSIREICECFGWRSTFTATGHLEALSVKGYIERDKATSRGIRVLA